MRVSGVPDFKIEPELLVFQNANRHYQINGVPDDVEGYCYRTQPKGWIDRTLFPEYFREPRVITALTAGRSCTLFIGNCPVHNDSTELTTSISEVKNFLTRFLANCTQLIQSLNQLILRGLKTLFRRKRSIRRAEIGVANMQTSTGRVQTPESIITPH